MNFSNDIPGPEALNALGWENLVTRRAKTKAKTMYKVLNKLAPSPLEKLFEHKRNITQYNLRGSSTSLQLPQPKTEKLKKSFSYDGAKAADVRGSATFTIFKTRLCATPRKNVCACVNFTEIGLMNRVFRACLFRNMAVKRSTSHMCLWSKIISKPTNV